MKIKFLRTAVIGIILQFGVLVSVSAAPPTFDSHGSLNSITDVPGIDVGQVTENEAPYLTGTTVIYAKDGATGGAYVPGGWPGNINYTVLQPGKNTQESHVVFLSGGSYYGLRVYGGIMRWLRQNHVGMKVGPKSTDVDPLVSGAIVYDLLRGGDSMALPDAKFGYMAMQKAHSGRIVEGNVGAGTGTKTGSAVNFPLKGGLGTASVQLKGGVVVGAIAAVNAVGSPVNFTDCSLRATHLEMGDEFGSYKTPSASECQNVLKNSDIKIDTASSSSDGNHPNTTIGVVATNVTLNKKQTNKLAHSAAEGQELAISPVHQLNDGDSFFALATGARSVEESQLGEIYAAARNAFARAIVHAILNASSVAGMSSYCDTFETACE